MGKLSLAENLISKAPGTTDGPSLVQLERYKERESVSSRSRNGGDLLLKFGLAENLEEDGRVNYNRVTGCWLSRRLDWMERRAKKWKRDCTFLVEECANELPYRKYRKIYIYNKKKTSGITKT